MVLQLSNKIEKPCALFSLAVLWFTLVLGGAFSAVFAKAFQPLICKNVRTVLGDAEGCGIQHLFFCLLIVGWKYDLCRYQFVVNTFFIPFTSIFISFFCCISVLHIYNMSFFRHIAYRYYTYAHINFCICHT